MTPSVMPAARLADGTFSCRDAGRLGTPRRSVAGIGMIELLIALVVLGVGLIGVTAALTRTLRVDRDALLRVVATQRTEDLVARVRANRPAVAAGGYALEARYADIDTTGPAAGACAAPAAACSGAQLAAVDLAEWNAGNARLLPGGRGAVAGDAARGHAVSLMWRDAALAAAGGTDPACTRKTPPESTIGLRCITVGFSP